MFLRSDASRAHDELMVSHEDAADAMAVDFDDEPNHEVEEEHGL